MKTHYFFCVGVCLLFTSCIVFNSGNVSSGPLLNASDKSITTAWGEAKSVFVFGIGDLSKDHLIQEAQADLQSKHTLAGNEYYSNMTCDISHKLIFGIVSINKVIVTASILRSGPAIESDTISNNPQAADNTTKKKISTQSYFVNEVDSFLLGETVYYKSKNGTVDQYVIESIVGSKVNLRNVEPKLSTQVLTSEPLYTMKKRIKGFKAGDRVKVRLMAFKEKEKITAVNNENALFSVGNEYYIKKLSDIKQASDN